MVNERQPLDPVVERKYRDLIERVLLRKQAAAELHISSGKPGVDFTISVVPRNPRAAPIDLDVADRNFVFMHLGRATTFEIPEWGGTNLPLGQTEQIEAFMTAVVEGKFEERLTYSGEKLVSGKSLVHLPNRDVTASWSRISSGLFGKQTERQIEYESYGQK